MSNEIERKYSIKDENIVLSGYRGSHAHGLWLPPEHEMSTDDIDLMGIALPDISYYHGFKEYGSNGTVEYWEGQYDVVIYEWRKMLRLLANANPNVLSLLWLKDEYYIQRDFAGNELIKNRSRFLTKKIYNTFTGYAHAQLEKMERFEHNGYMGEKRKQLVEKFGYDTKNAAHCIRLLRMGIEALNTGELQVYRTTDREELLAIKCGKFKLDEIKKMAQDLFNKARIEKDKCNLPEEFDWDWLNRFSIKNIAHTTTLPENLGWDWFNDINIY